MKIFFDTEFTELSVNAKLLSIGCISENGEHFYAEMTGVVLNTVSDWVKENVIKNMFFLSKPPYKITDNLMKINKIPKIKAVYGNRKEVSEKFNKWLKSFKEDIEFVSDVSSYDFVLLVDLITNGGTSLDLPGYISPACFDINQSIAEFEEISLKDAFDLNREKYANQDTDLQDTEEPVENDFILKDVMGSTKHNSLWDAHVIKIIYDSLI